MVKVVLILTTMLFSFTFANGVQVLGQAKSDKQSSTTILDIVVDTTSKDSHLPFYLKQFLIHGRAAAGNTSITYFSNNKVADLPATVSIPNGLHNLNATSGRPGSIASFKVDALGGYQKWQLTPGNHKVANAWRLPAMLADIAVIIGGSMVLTDLIIGDMAGEDDEGKLLGAGLITMGASLTISIPSHIMVWKNAPRAKLLESRVSAPQKALDMQGVVQ